MIKLFVLTLSLLISNGVTQSCLPDWIAHEESCYGMGEDAINWADAVEICEIFGAKLAEVESATENDFLKNLSRSKGDHYYWLGGTDIFHEGVWRWASTSEIMSFTDWGPGQPGDSGEGQDCVLMDRGIGTGYQWNDGDCGGQANFICEASPREEPIVG